MVSKIYHNKHENQDLQFKRQDHTPIRIGNMEDDKNDAAQDPDLY